MVTPAARREAAAHLCSVHGVSPRRACRTIGVERTSIRYRHRRVDDGAMRSRLRELAAIRRRFGWRRLHVLLSREGARVNHKKLRRLYVEEPLQVRRRGGRKRALGTRAPMGLPQGPNQRWSLDYVSDTPTDGRRFRILAMVDDYTRECLCLVADTSLSGLRVVRELDALIARRGRPVGCVSDNGTELTSMAILRWSQTSGVDWHYVAPGKPTQNAFIESFNGRLQRRAVERDAVHLACSRTRCPRGMAARLQHRTSAQRARQSDAGRLRGPQRLCSATAWGAALNHGLRAPGCCNTGPERPK
jgi:putative transposase